MKKVLVLGAGGAPATNVIRSLHGAPERIFIVGADMDNLELSEADKNYLTEDNMDRYARIVEEEQIQFVHAQPDGAVNFLSKNRKRFKELGCSLFLPSDKTLRICADKFLSYEKWRKTGIKVPKTIRVRTSKDLESALVEIPCGWFRKSVGAFGKGSIPLDDDDKNSLTLARIWMRYWGGDFVLSERLNPQKTITWQSIFKDGELVVAQTRQRMGWLFADRTVSGVTGITKAATTVRSEMLDDLAQDAIHAVDPKPNGVFGVDCTFDDDGVPNPTEINAGRFFTTIDFFTKAGLNMPYIYLKVGLGEYKMEIDMSQIERVWVNFPEKLNPIPPGYRWIRGMDVEPRLMKHLSEG